MNYLVNNEFYFEVFDDGDVMACGKAIPRSFILNKTTWYVIQLFNCITSYGNAKEKFINHYNRDKIFLSDEFEKIFKNLLKNEIIIGV